MVKIYKGNEIKYFDIARMKYIASKRYSRPIYEFYYEDIYSLECLAKKIV